MPKSPSRILGRRYLVALISFAAVLFAASPAFADGGTLTLHAARPTKKPAIVGGTAISIGQAPWQVYVQADFGGGVGEACGGSIIDARTVLTAGHCVYDRDTLSRDDPSQITVFAGISNLNDLPTAQRAGVANIRVHPGYQFTADNLGVAPDDVAVLQLSSALDLSGPDAQPISLLDAGAYPAQGTAGFISGFGLQQGGATQPDGQLYGVGTAIGDPLSCGGDANAVVDCISSTTGSACEGDSGGPLTIGALLAGVASFVTTDGPTGECGVGSINGYTNLAAAEIRDFVLGNDNPPIAPRGGTDVSASAQAWQSGATMTCSAGTWSGAPTFVYSFTDTRNGQVLQSGASPTYTFTDGDVGRTVACGVSATNPGGTGITRTEASPAIAAKPAPPVTPPPTSPTPPPARRTPARRAPSRRAAPAKPSLRLTVKASSSHVKRGTTVKYTIHVANTGRGAAKAVVVCDAPGKGLAFGKLPKGAKKSSGRACWSLGTVKARSSRTLRVAVRVLTSAPAGGVVRNAVSLRSANGGRHAATAGVRVLAVQRRGPTRPPAVTG